MEETAKILAGMIEHSDGNAHDIAHFVKVWGFARAIAEAEGLDPAAKRLLEITAITHDIACPLCRKKYGSAYGKKQELEGPALARKFLGRYDLPRELVERAAWLIGHHHTYSGINALDWQMLVEADFLVNADEGGLSRKGIASFRDKVFRTACGKNLLDSIYLRV